MVILPQPGLESTLFPGFFPTSRENLGTKLGRSFGRFVLSASSETQGQLQSSSKILKHFPNVDLGITVVSVLQNTRGSTLGRERAHYSENKSVRSKTLKNFPENSRETVSVSTICDEYCSRNHSIVTTSCPWVSEDVLIIMNLSQQQL